MLDVTLAYKYVLITAMMSQINYYAPRMHLPLEIPVKEEDIRFLHVSPPVISGRLQLYSGRIQVRNYSFSFSDTWRHIYNLDEHGFVSFGVPMGPNESGASGMERASKMRYVVGTNDVYRMATNWLVALDVNLEKLEAAKPPRVEQGMFHSDRGLVPSPMIIVDWKNPKIPGYDPTAVRVEVSAVSGELLKLSDGNAFSNRKQPLIKDLKKLLAISDDEFLKYTEQQRKELVERFGGERCSITNVPAGIYDKFFMPKGTSNPSTPEKKEEKP